jgi:hypothetical protein
MKNCWPNIELGPTILSIAWKSDFFLGNRNWKKYKKKEDRIQQVRKSVITDSENEDLLTKLRKAKLKLIRLGYNEKLSPEEKLTRIRHAALEMVQDVKMELVDLKRSLVFTKTMEEILSIAKAVRDLINANFFFGAH